MPGIVVMRQLAVRPAVLVLLLAPIVTLGAQVQRGAVQGVVSDQFGHPMPGARVEVRNTDIRTTTDADGKYLLVGVWPGQTEIRVRHILLEPRAETVLVRPADTTRADVTMSYVQGTRDGDAVALPGMETNAAAPSRRPGAFAARVARGGAAFITRAEIEKRQPHALSEMLRQVAGITTRPGTAAGQLPVVEIDRSASATATRTCEVQLYVDGLPYLHGNIDDFPPETVEGLEIYRGGSNLPAEFRAANAGCGLIAVWTRDPSLIRRAP